MISSKGQATNEALVTASVMLIGLIAGLILMLHGMATVILSRWASRTCHCVAQGDIKESCEAQTQRSLIEDFAFHQVNVRTSTRRGIIHTEIHAHLLKATLMGSYDLSPSEYKRVK